MLNRIIYKFSKQKWHNTTILAVKKGNEISLIGDGQVSLGSTRVKTNANKIRQLPNNVYCGFAGSVADAFYLLEGLEQQIKKYPEQTLRSCIEYAKEWRTGKQLRHLEATLIVVDKNLIVELDGSGNVLEIDDVVGIGSGGLFAECAARALIDVDGFDSQAIAYKSMNIAAQKCIYTSNEFRYQKITWN